MDFNFKNKTFNLDLLEQINLNDLKVNTISRGHLFHLIGKNKKPFLLLRAGDFIDQSFISKYQDKGLNTIHRLKLADDIIINEYKNIFKEMLFSKNQDSLFTLRDKIFIAISQDFLIKQNKSFLNYTIACYECCFLLPHEIIELYHSRSMVLYTRAILSSAISTLVLLANGHVDFVFIKEFYNTAFTIDIGLLLKGQTSYHLIKACEVERNNPGEGLEYLKRNSLSDQKIFNEHPLKGYERLMEYSELFIYPEIIENIKYHHEKFDGSGFPEGYYYSVLSETETMLTFCDYIVPFEEFIFHEKDGIEILSQYFDKIDQTDKNSILPIKKLMKNWESIIRWATSVKEVAS